MFLRQLDLTLYQMYRLINLCTIFQGKSQTHLCPRLDVLASDHEVSGSLRQLLLCLAPRIYSPSDHEMSGSLRQLLLCLALRLHDLSDLVVSMLLRQLDLTLYQMYRLINLCTIFQGKSQTHLCPRLDVLASDHEVSGSLRQLLLCLAPRIYSPSDHEMSGSLRQLLLCLALRLHGLSDLVVSMLLRQLDLTLYQMYRLINLVYYFPR